MFKYGKRSLYRLSQGHIMIQQFAHRTLELSPIDITIAEVLRDIERQKELVAAKKSFTMNSRHLTGHAVDMWAYVDGQVSWNWNHYYEIAKAAHKASDELGLDIVWGGVWDRRMNQMSGDIRKEVCNYIQRRKEVRPDKNVLLDGPHFQLDWKKYPA